MRNLLTGLVCLVLFGCGESSESIPPTEPVSITLGQEETGTTRYADIDKVFRTSGDFWVMTFDYTEVEGGSLGDLHEGMSVTYWADFSAWIVDASGGQHLCYFPYKIRI